MKHIKAEISLRK